VIEPAHRVDVAPESAARLPTDVTHSAHASGSEATAHGATDGTHRAAAKDLRVHRCGNDEHGSQRAREKMT
jgi:hypothetical protein